MSSSTIEANVLVAGQASGPALVLQEPLSFWGGFDPATGEIIDTHHPEYRQSVTGKVLFMPASRGSAGTPGGIAETLRNGSGPKAFVLGQCDVNIGVGTQVANQLYQLEIPVLEISLQQMLAIANGTLVSIDRSGKLLIGG